MIKNDGWGSACKSFDKAGRWELVLTKGFYLLSRRYFPSWLCYALSPAFANAAKLSACNKLFSLAAIAANASWLRIQMELFVAAPAVGRTTTQEMGPLVEGRPFKKKSIFLKKARVRHPSEWSTHVDTYASIPSASTTRCILCPNHWQTRSRRLPHRKYADGEPSLCRNDPRRFSDRR